MVDFKKILFPVHLSEISPKVAPYVRAVAQKFDAEIHLLHVARGFDHYVDVYVVEDTETRFKKLVSNLEKEISSGAKGRLLQFKKDYFEDYPNTKVTVATGNIYEEILHYAESEGIDLIIMGTYRRTFANRYIFGAAAEKVAELSSIPVMLVKQSETGT
jgi:nucleotide-binding universal stress UspA family protein